MDQAKAKVGEIKNKIDLAVDHLDKDLRDL